jgi:hypothetical protein
MLYNVKKLETEIFGLKYEPRIIPEELNNTDWCAEAMPGYGDPPQHFTECNIRELLSAYRSIEKVETILEIGVHRPGRGESASSTMTLFKEKADEVIYIGVDIEDKKRLDNAVRRIYTIQADSIDYEGVIEFAKRRGVSNFDFIFIDGYHSVEHTLKDWRYIQLLSADGIAGFHDINGHPGPHVLWDAIDRDIFETVRCCPTDDYGLGFIKRMK